MATKKIKKLTYKDSGVDIEAGDEMVDKIRPLVERTYSPRVMGAYGGFAGMFRLDFAEKLLRKNYEDPILVGCTDGVGTKLKVAFMAGKIDTVGIDLVAMNVNDLICCGAEPLFFLDYLGVGKLAPNKMAEILKGISDGCVDGCCSLLGGETAEMPDFYDADEFDMAGFAVGVVEKKKIIDGSATAVGDVAIAVASSGLHSNGYGLARRVIFDRASYRVTDKPPELGGITIGEELLKPTKIYVKPVLEILNRYRTKKVVKAMAHITGGGLEGNLMRVIPEGLTVKIARDSWPVPPIFKLIEKKGPVDHAEMMRVFNMGIGFVMVVAEKSAEQIMAALTQMNLRCWPLGKVKRGGPEIQWA